MNKKTKYPMIAGSGSGKGGGGSGGGGVELPDSLRSIAVAKVLDLICEGPIEGLVDGTRSIYLNDTPLESVQSDGRVVKNFKNIEWNIRYGTLDQTYLSKFAAAETEIQVNAEVEYDTPVTRTIYNTTIDAARITVGIPQLVWTDLNTGNVYGSAVEIAIAVSNNGGAFVRQIIGTTWSEDDVEINSAGVLQTSTACVALQFVISGTCSPYNIYGVQTSYTIQYRESGGSWITYQVVTIPPTILTSYINVVTLTGLPEANYEVQITDIAYGSAALSGPKRGLSSDSDIIIGKTLSRYQRSYRVTLPEPGPWDIRIIRISPDSTLQNHQCQTWWDTYTEIIDSKFSYPYSAIMAISADASQFNAIPTRAYKMRLKIIRVPNNYDPINRVYDGIWDGTFKLAWSDNPAWCFYDLVTHERYGLGKYISEDLVDKWTLYSIAQYCDGLVPSGFKDENDDTIYEPRFVLNCYIQTREEAYKLIQDLASVFRGMAYWAEGTITSTQDAPVASSMLFNTANVIDGTFNYTGSAKRARHTVALVTWNDPQNMCKQAIEYVEDHEGIQRFGINEIQMTAFGCTSRGQARRVGKWALYSEKFETDLVTFRTGMEGCYIRPGDVIQIADPCRGTNRIGGRLTDYYLQEGNGVVIAIATLDREVTFVSDVSYTLSCILPDGTMETQTITNAPGTTTLIILDSKYSQTPIAGAVWLLNSDVVDPALYRVVAISEPEPMIVEIIGLSHNPNKYDYIEYDEPLDQPWPDLPPNYLLPPEDFAITEELYLGHPNLPQINVIMHWKKSPDPRTIFYILKWRKSQTDGSTGKDNWEEASVYFTEYAIKNVPEGFYDFSIEAVGYNRLLSEAVTLTNWHIDGITGYPPDVTGLNTIGGNGEFVSTDCEVRWDSVVSSSFPLMLLRGYLVEVLTNDSVPVNIRTEYVTTTRYIYTYQKSIEDGVSMSNFLIRVWTFSVSGEYSQNYAEIECTQVSSLTGGEMTLVAVSGPELGEITLSLLNPSPAIVKVELWYSSWVNDRSYAVKKSTHYDTTSFVVYFNRPKYFWVKVFYGEQVYEWVPESATGGVLGIPGEYSRG